MTRKGAKNIMFAYMFTCRKLPCKKAMSSAGPAKQQRPSWPPDRSFVGHGRLAINQQDVLGAAFGLADVQRTEIPDGRHSKAKNFFSLR